MSIVRTIELRWFFEKSLPQFTEWKKWEPTRTDFYAPIKSERTSIKLRN